MPDSEVSQPVRHLRTLLSTDDFQRLAAGGTEITYQFPQFCCRHFVSGGMRQHRRATGRGYPLDDLSDRWPQMTYIACLAIAKIFPESCFEVFAETTIDQATGEMRTPNTAIAGHRRNLWQEVGELIFLESLRDFLCPQNPCLLLLLDATPQVRIAKVDVEANNMDAGFHPARGELDAGYKRQPRQCPGRETAIGIDRIVIGDRKMADSLVDSAPNQIGRGQRAV